MSKDGSTIYEGELRPFKLWKLTNGENGGDEGQVKKRPETWGERIWDFLGWK